MTPHALYSVCVSACTLVNEASVVVNGAVRVTFRVEIPVCSPAITDDRSAGFDPCIYNGHQGVDGSVRNGNDKRFTGLALNTAKNPLPFNRVAPMIFAPKELAFVDLEGLVMTADLRRAALHVHQHRPSAEKVPCHDCIGTEAMLFLYNVGRYTAHEVVFRYITSCKVSLLCWNHESCLIDFVSEHMTAALLRHRHLKPSFGLGSAHQVISRPQVLYGTLLGSNPTSFKNWMPRSVSLKRNARNSLFASLLSPSEARP